MKRRGPFHTPRAGVLRLVTGVGGEHLGRRLGGGEAGEAEVDFGTHLPGWKHLQTSDPRAVGWKYGLHGQNSLGNCQKFPLCCADPIKR